MTKLSVSPRYAKDQIDRYLNRKGATGEEPSPDYLEMIKTSEQRKREQEQDPEWAKDNLEHALRSTDWILEKVRASETYAQNLYAALCNNEFQPNDVWPILSDKKWSCSRRYAGGILADMREQGDYLDWYCSGIRDSDDPDNGYVAESVVTEEIKQDLLKLGWIVLIYEEGE